MTTCPLQVGHPVIVVIGHGRERLSGVNRRARQLKAPFDPTSGIVSETEERVQLTRGLALFNLGQLPCQIIEELARAVIGPHDLFKQPVGAVKERRGAIAPIGDRFEAVLLIIAVANFVH